MDRNELMQHLDAAKRRAKLVEEKVDRQRETVARLFAEGSDITEAENRLRALQHNQLGHLADANRFLNALNGRRVGWPVQGQPQAAYDFRS